MVTPPQETTPGDQTAKKKARFIAGVRLDTTPPRETTPGDKQATIKSQVYHRGTLDTTRPQETTPGDKGSKARNTYPPGECTDVMHSRSHH